jgi:soluble lytic murein transglycosylase
LGATVAVLLLLADPAPAASPSWRLSLEPRSAAEAAVREAAQTEGAIAALDAVSQRLAATPAGGLARLAAGLELLDAARPQDALAELTHPDIDKTLLRDHAFLAASRAHEALGRIPEAAAAALAAADEPGSALVCAALPRAAELLRRAGQESEALATLERTAAACPEAAPLALLELGTLQLARGERAAAATAFERLDREYPLAQEAKQARARLAGLTTALPPLPAADRARRLLERGSALLAAGRAREALESLRAVSLVSLSRDEADLARVRLGRALVARGRYAEGRAVLLKVEAGSPHAAEAAFRLAADSARHAQRRALSAGRRPLPGNAVGRGSAAVAREPLPEGRARRPRGSWWRRLLAEYPDGRYAERAAWRAGWDDYRAGRFEQAAQTFEGTARRRTPGSATAGLLYWSGRSRLALGQNDRARELFRETVQRYKNAYHGVRAQDAIARLGGVAALPVVTAEAPVPDLALPEPRASRARQLLLIERLDEAATELRLLPETPRVTATVAWVDWRRGRLRAAITAMKRAYPEWIGEGGDRLPREVWQVMFPMRFDQELLAAAREDSLDPALVAALILQESSYDPDALSRAARAD